MRALITGASGFVGRHLVQHLRAHGDEVTATFFPAGSLAASDCAKDSPSNLGPGNRGVLWELLDIADLEACAAVFSKAQPDVVYHLAGMSFVPDAESDFMGALRSNVYGFDNVLRVCHQLQRSIRVLLVSSADVYGKVPPQELPVREETVTRPINAYSCSKLMAELVAERWTRLGNVEVVTARPFNHIGPGQNVRFVAASFAHQLALIRAKQAEPRIMVGNLSSKKDFCDVRDVVRAYRLAATRGQGSYVISSGRSVAVQDILDSLIEIAGIEVEVAHDPARMRPSEVTELFGSYAKAERELGWKPEIPMRQTLADIFSDALQRLA